MLSREREALHSKLSIQAGQIAATNEAWDRFVLIRFNAFVLIRFNLINSTLLVSINSTLLISINLIK